MASRESLRSMQELLATAGRSTFAFASGQHGRLEVTRNESVEINAPDQDEELAEADTEDTDALLQNCVYHEVWASITWCR